ncbi:hypothetical protein [Streptomyces sp. NRRL S-350]|uniref:hypothetical protein n=1 Tax=Streptomyces sp. NRRL S-350 TaxID=1463902 RepID=UPI00068B1753|nr:hypothetical protein [Streptomyces sp. NRRL S-350]
MKRVILTTVALLGAAAVWLTPAASASATTSDHAGPTAAVHLDGTDPTPTSVCPGSTRCNDTSWGG